MISTSGPRVTRNSSAGILEEFSLEVTVGDLEKLMEAGADIPSGTIVSIPHLPRERSDARAAAARTIRQAGYDPLPHLALRRFETAADLESFLASLVEEAQADRLLVLAGDLENRNVPFPDSVSMLRSGLIQKYGIRHVAVAGHPEGHPKVDRQTLAEALREKQKMLSDLGVEWSIMTQFAFSAEPVLQWIEAVRQDGIEVPIRIGLPGPANARTLLRFAAMCGVGASTAVLKKYGLSVTQLLSTAGPQQLVSDYLASLSDVKHGQTRMHFYPFGGLEKTTDWIRAFRLKHSLPFPGHARAFRNGT